MNLNQFSFMQMPPRPYNNETRQLQQAELKARIAAAAARLHATQGALAPSYAQIAQEAGVSLPTVYKHFPALDDLVRACTSHVIARAPEVPQQRILDAHDLPSAALALVEACDRANAYFEPWTVWREQRQIATLAAIEGRQRSQLRQLCAAVLRRHGGEDGHGPTAAVWESLLHFDFWHRLVREHGLARPAVRERQHQLLLAAAGPWPATTSTKRPTRKSQP